MTPHEAQTYRHSKGDKANIYRETKELCYKIEWMVASNISSIFIIIHQILLRFLSVFIFQLPVYFDVKLARSDWLSKWQPQTHYSTIDEQFSAVKSHLASPNGQDQHRWPQPPQYWYRPPGKSHRLPSGNLIRLKCETNEIHEDGFCFNGFNY